MADKTAKEIGEEVHRIALSGFGLCLEKHGITDDTLAIQLKAELKAKVTRTIKIKGAVSTDNLTKGHRIIATSGVIYHNKDGDDYGDGDTVISYNEIDWNTRQKARMDAHALRGDYPAEKHVFPDKDGNPQEIGMGSIEAAARIAYLIKQAMERKSGNSGE